MGLMKVDAVAPAVERYEISRQGTLAAKLL
jgi:hypothetical protein